MTIRTRMTLWYAGVLFVSLVAMGALTYREFAPESSPVASAGERERQGDDKEDLRETFGILLWCGVPAVLLSLGGGWWLMRKALAPVAALTTAASQINEHNLKESLPRSGNGDELDRLTEVFNAMIARLDGSFQRIREFTLHASHELKTPLTVLHSELESALQDDRLPPPYRERCEAQLSEVQRLAQIVDALTLLTKADAGQIKLSSEPVQLDELLQDAFADAQILAQPHNLRVSLGICEPLEVVGDRNRLRQLLLNLTDNAVKYNVPNGEVKLALRHVETQAELTVANTGLSVPAETQARVFDRFFRGDASHSDEVEGSGLGLSIAQWIVSIHGGSIAMSSQPGGLTTLTVRLPIKSK